MLTRQHLSVAVDYFDTHFCVSLNMESIIFFIGDSHRPMLFINLFMHRKDSVAQVCDISFLPLADETDYHVFG